jgi:hypothetical protein
MHTRLKVSQFTKGPKPVVNRCEFEHFSSRQDGISLGWNAFLLCARPAHAEGHAVTAPENMDDTRAGWRRVAGVLRLALRCSQKAPNRSDSRTANVIRLRILPVGWSALFSQPTRHGGQRRRWCARPCELRRDCGWSACRDLWHWGVDSCAPRHPRQRGCMLRSPIRMYYL